jgi:myo-inositol-1(or 4)-monophosphatase
MPRPSLSEIESLARGAGEILRQGFSLRPGIENKVQVKYKSEIDPVTEMDQLSEAYLVERIRQRYPDHSINTEESGQLKGDVCCTWYLDPIDGTVNYAHGIPLFGVSIAYAEGGVPLVGAVYNPIAEEFYTAERGRGAWLNGLPLRVGSASTLIQSLLVTGFPYDIKTNPRNNLALYSRLSLASQGVRRLGTAAIDLCYVAAGRVDGFWEMSIMAYDVAAGGLIAEEAGAVVTNVYGRPAYLTPPCSILAANPAIHAQLLEVIQETYPEPQNR